ncbi:MAG: hypothetical protein ABIQ52_13380 [Vicinamibacterales bacterium]
MRALLTGFLLLAVARQAPPARVEILRSTTGLPAHIAGIFREPLAFQQTDAGQYFVFDRRAHAVFTIANDAARKIVDIGAEAGRVLDPTAFDLDPSDGSFVVADAPLRRPRVQVFTAEGARLAGFTMAERERPRLLLDHVMLNGIGSIQYSRGRLLINQPESGGLISELEIYGTPVRTFGQLRPTGQEADANVHLALNSGLPLADPTGGYYFVFSAGIPLFRKYDAQGRLLFERHVEGPEVDEYLKTMPTRWPTRKTEDGDVLPIVPPAVRTAGVDREGRLWIALMGPVTYVYDSAGEKVRKVQFRGAGALTPNSLFFSKDGRILVTPGCYEFRITP